MSKRPTNKNNNLFIETNDDGGAAKGNDRLYRRKRRRIIEVISIPLGFIIIIGFLIQVQHHLNDKMASKRMRNKDYLDQMKKNFRIENTKNNNSNTNNIINSNEGKPGYGRKQPLKKYRWIDLRQLPPLDNGRDWIKKYLSKDSGDELRRNNGEGFRVRYGDQQLWWETLAEQLDVGENIKNQSPTVDYTKMKYTYPDPMLIPPEDGSYPPMVTMEALFDKWPQENIDSPPNPFVETLQHFDFGDPQQVEAAIKYRDLELPFKVYNIPEIDAAGQKWTDDYLSYHFDRTIGGLRGMFTNTKKEYDYMPPSSGKAQYSLDSFFAFFNARNWSIEKMGPPPTLDTDLTFEKWAKHARYADAVGLEPNQVHYYWQSGVSRSERTRSKDRWTMISNDLPSFSSPEPTFFSFNPEEQKGIQCRFGERGVTAATHYDGGRNMVGMITGAKRYILSPPIECPKLGIISTKKHPTYRHSLLNFGHISLLDKKDPELEEMPELEREWLNKSKAALAIDTVLKAGEVLYIPSHWFHYIVSLQKSAQCNVRSGIDFDGNPIFGGRETVETCVAGSKDD